jgi:hypothetical protein
MLWFAPTRLLMAVAFFGPVFIISVIAGVLDLLHTRAYQYRSSLSPYDKAASVQAKRRALKLLKEEKVESRRLQARRSASSTDD